jgi:hypothetical protein
MKYYEIWFYYYGENDDRTDYAKEFTFYTKAPTEITSDEEMIAYLKKTYPKTDKYKEDELNCIFPHHYPHLSKWFEISGQEFTYGCGVPA